MWDCHTHVFGPYAAFPLAADRSYTPPEATLEMYLAHLDRCGLAHGVLVQPSAYGSNHAALLDALKRANGRLHGTGVANAGIADRDLEEWNRHGVRGLRFVETGGPNGGRYVGAVGLDELPKLAPRLKALRWHAEVWATTDQVVAMVPAMLRLGLPIAIDHMARFDVARGVRDAAFQSLLGMVRDGLWIKLTPQRNSRQFPDYADARPFHDAFLAANPDRVIWGSDWPYLRMGEQTPDARHLLELLGGWCGDDALRRKVLVDNPAKLYQA